MEVAPRLTGDGADALAHSRARGLEGVVAKRLDSAYLPGKRSRTWVKEKHWRVQRVTIGGWRRGAGARAGGIGSLLVGIEHDRTLHYAGRVGTGFSAALLTRLAAELAPLRRDTSPFAESLDRVERRDVVWVEPVRRAEVRYFEWTEAGRLRHPAFVRFVD
jgi:bifunctional non-homologous end joining protein LigD